MIALVVALSSVAAEPCQLVMTSPALGTQWHAAAEEIGCVDAAIALDPARDGAVLSLKTRDGRTAMRSITAPGEVAAVVSGLLATIPPEPPPREPAPPPVELVAIEPPAPALPSPRAESAGLATVAATFGTRVGLPVGVVSTELELRGDLRVGSWIFALTGRSSPTGTRFGGDRRPDWEYAEFSIGALGGRLVHVGSGALTITAGPRYGVVTRETETTTTNRKDVWIQAGARYVFALGDRWRPCVSTNLEGAVTRLVSSANAFPVWAGSLRVGVVGSVP